MVKHSDDSHEAPPLGCRLDDGFEEMDGKLVELVITIFLNQDWMMTCDLELTQGVYKHTLQLGKKLKRWDVQVVGFLR